VVDCGVTRFCAVLDGLANSAEKIAAFVDGLVFVAGLTKLNGGFRLEVLSSTLFIWNTSGEPKDLGLLFVAWVSNVAYNP
jgi:hypothetical protein